MNEIQSYSMLPEEGGDEGGGQGSRSLFYIQTTIQIETPVSRKKWFLYFWNQMVYRGLRLVEREWTWTMAVRCGADVPSGSFTRFTPRSILMRMNFRPCDTISSRSGPHRSAICDMTLFFLSLWFLFVLEVASICGEPHPSVSPSFSFKRGMQCTRWTDDTRKY